MSDFKVLPCEDMMEKIKMYEDEQVLGTDRGYLSRKSSDLADALLRTCLRADNIPSLYPLIDFDEPRYRELPVTRSMHDAPRFGKSRDMAVIVTGNEKEAQKYMRGLHAVAITSWVFFGLWALLLLYCWKKRKMAWLSGRTPQHNNRKEETTEGKKTCWKLRKMAWLPGRPRLLNQTEEEETGNAMSPDKEPAVSNFEAPATSEEYSSENNANGPINNLEEQRTTGFSEEQETEGLSSSHPLPKAIDFSEDQETKEHPILVLQPNEERHPLIGWDERNGYNKTGDATVEEIVQKFAITVRKCRIAMLASGSVMLVASTLLLVYGLPAADEVLVSSQTDVPNLLDVVGDSHNATSEFLIVFNNTVNARIETVDLILDSCEFVNDTVQDVFLDLQEILEIPLNGDVVNFLNESYPELTFYTVILGINETLDNATIIGNLISGIDGTLSNVWGLLNVLDNVLTTIEGWWYYPVGAFIIMLMLMTLSFMTGAILAWREAQPPWLNRTNSRYLLPFFCFSLFLFYVIATYNLIFSIGLSDYCVVSPDEQVTRMLQAPWYLDEFVSWYITVSFWSFVAAIKFYLGLIRAKRYCLQKGCNPLTQPRIHVEIAQAIAGVARITNEGLLKLSEFVASADYSPSLCNGNIQAVVTALTIVSARFDALLKLSLDMIETLRCARFHPTYAHLSYETACDKGIVATTYSFVYLFLMAISSMIIVTVRVGWQDDIQLDTGGKGEPEQDPNNAVQDGENTDDAAEKFMDEPVHANGPDDVSENGGRLDGQLPTDEVICIDDDRESNGSAQKAE